MASILPVHQFNIKSKIKSLGIGQTGHWALAKQGIGHCALGIGSASVPARFPSLVIGHWSLAIGQGGRREEDIHSNLFSDRYFTFN